MSGEICIMLKEVLFLNYIQGLWGFIRRVHVIIAVELEGNTGSESKQEIDGALNN